MSVRLQVCGGLAPQAAAMLGTARSSARYQSVKPPRTPLRRRIWEISASEVSWGRRPIEALLRREGCLVQQKPGY